MVKTFPIILICCVPSWWSVLSQPVPLGHQIWKALVFSSCYRKSEIISLLSAFSFSFFIFLWHVSCSLCSYQSIHIFLFLSLNLLWAACCLISFTFSLEWQWFVSVCLSIFQQTTKHMHVMLFLKNVIHVFVLLRWQWDAIVRTTRMHCRQFYTNVILFYPSTTFTVHT